MCNNAHRHTRKRGAVVSDIPLSFSGKAIALLLRESVFVVDDDPSMRTSMDRLLRGYGFATTLFDTGGALLDHDRFHTAICIILDINLGARSGIEVRQSLTEKGIEAPVIYVTGNDSPANRSAAIASGCIAYLIKPFAAQSLIESVQRARAL
ncbi:response regulator [Bradyrhizobium sp. NBAIM08]|nr:response regulator [Bradyrhizobium sp. IC4060]MCA1474698.1 response regulator [Bradyrhizobium sp. NBAIM08]MCA1486963.1 response regulator [Bradyrhizobium sp. IC4061]MCA1540754.1 response regulator [Bradyrhizobium sp. NBAIM32]